MNFSNCHNFLVLLESKIYLLLINLDSETWSLPLRERWGLRTFENRILRRMFEPKRDKNGEWRRIHIEELHGLYRSLNIVRMIKSRRLRWAGHVVRMEEGRSTTKIVTG